MRFTVTALGGDAQRGIAAVVQQVSDYLHGPKAETPRAAAAGASGGAQPGGPGRYYADATNGEPGRWLGLGATELALSGEVERGDLEAVLGGRDPHNGGRLITARGSAGRVASVGAGTAARWDEHGEALYSVADAAAVLRWSHREVQEAIEEGELAAQRALVSGLTGGPLSSEHDETGIALVPWIASDGTCYVSHSELVRVEGAVRDGATAEELLARGEPDEVLSVPTAARELGVSESYVRRLCRTYEEHADEIAAAREAGEQPKRAYVVGQRDSGGSWRIRRDDLADFASRRRRPAVRLGYDVTATTEKSFSLLGLLSGPRVRDAVLAAVEEANDAGVAWLEQHAAAARAGDEVVGVTGWTVASFRHLTSRRLDPFVHHHNVVHNTVVDEHGIRRALDARRLYTSVRGGAAIATAQARFGLTDRLGVSFRRARHGGWEIAGISDEAIDEYSQRNREIREAAEELERALGRVSTLDELRAVVAKTRPIKETVSSDAELLRWWWERAASVGLAEEGLRACLGRARPTVLTRELRAKVLAALERAVTAERSVFTRSDVLATLVDLPLPDGDGPLVVTGAALEGLAEDFLASPAVVPLAGRSGRADVLHRRDGTTIAVGGQGEPEYTTAEMLAIQARTAKRYASLAGRGWGRVEPAAVAATLARFPELNGEQRGLVETFCSSGDGAQSAVGLPGSGKTHATRAAVEAWRAAGYRVVGAAVKGSAARHLGSVCGVPAEPLAWYLARLGGDPLTAPLDARTVLVVDEASTIGDRDLDSLLAAAERCGAAVRLIGDPAQHGAVAAGGLWRVLTQQAPGRTPQLTLTKRVRNSADRVAARALRDGQPGDALAALESAGHLHIVPDERELYVALLNRWWSSRQHGEAHHIITRRNDQRLVLNRLARRIRHYAGELGGAEVTASGDRRFAVGDEVVARRGDRSLHPTGRPQDYVRNGSHGTVVDVHAAEDPGRDRITVDFPDLGTIQLPRAFFDEHRSEDGSVDVGLDHDYAITSYGAQGLTFPRSSSHVDPHSTRPEVYVDITRGQDGNELFVTAPEDPLSGERLPALPPPPERDRLEQRLSRSGPEITAIELDDLAGAAALHARGKTLAQLTQQRLAARDGAHTLLARAEHIRAQQVHCRARNHPNPALQARLIARPAEAFLQARWDSIVGDIAVYRARWQAAGDRGSAWAWAVGEAVAHPEAAHQRQQLIDRIDSLSIDTIRRRLPDGPDALTEAARQLVASLAATGTLGQIPIDELTDALQRASHHNTTDALQHLHQLAAHANIEQQPDGLTVEPT